MIQEISVVGEKKRSHATNVSMYFIFFWTAYIIHRKSQKYLNNKALCSYIYDRFFSGYPWVTLGKQGYKNNIFFLFKIKFF